MLLRQRKIWFAGGSDARDSLQVVGDCYVFPVAQECADPVWLREADGRYRPFGAADVTALRAHFRARGREAVLDT